MAAIDKEHIVFNNGKLWKKPVSSGNFKLHFTSYGEVCGVTNKLDKYARDENFNIDILPCVTTYDGYDTLNCTKKVASKLHFFENESFNFYSYEKDDINYGFLFDNQGNHYAWIGGYGHYKNPFLHFINRGYGEEFEKKMLKECYKYLMTNILEEIAIERNRNPFARIPLLEDQDLDEESHPFTLFQRFEDKIREEYKYQDK